MKEKTFAIPGEAIREVIPHMGGCLATDRITVDGSKVGYMYREAPDHPSDSGWRFFSGDESDEYMNDPSNVEIYTVNTIANYDPDIIPHLRTEAPCAFEKIPGTSSYRRVEE